MDQDPVGNPLHGIPLDNRLQPTGIIVARYAQGCIAAALENTEAGIVDASTGLRPHTLTCTDEAVPDTGSIARAAGRTLGVLGS